MKKTLLSVALLTLSTGVSASNFECYRYVSGHPTGGWVNVTADSKSAAVSIAWEKFKNLGGKVDNVKCNYK